MQNRYVGDVADFGKHGLLRFLSGMTDPTVQEPDLRLGLVWYMHHDERHGADGKKVNRDGKFISYLEPTLENIELFGKCDRELWNKLGHLVGLEARCVHCAELADILPGSTAYYNAQLYYMPKMEPDMKKSLRAHWWAEALKATNDAKIVCVDPDNGIAPNAGKMYRKEGPKFVYMSDLKAIWDRGWPVGHLGGSDPVGQQHPGHFFPLLFPWCPLSSTVRGPSSGSPSQRVHRFPGVGRGSTVPHGWPPGT